MKDHKPFCTEEIDHPGQCLEETWVVPKRVQWRSANIVMLPQITNPKEPEKKVFKRRASKRRKRLKRKDWVYTEPWMCRLYEPPGRLITIPAPEERKVLALIEVNERFEADQIPALLGFGNQGLCDLLRRMTYV